MTVQRQVMKFLIPVTIEAIGRSDLTGRSVIPLYLNPSSISITDAKIIPTPALTKGGYVVQYWGEQLTKIQVGGTTGSGGIEAINILQSVYRNEQIVFEQVLADRARLFDEATRDAINNSSSATASAGITTILDGFTQGGFSGIVNGIDSTIESITDAATGLTNDVPERVELIPSLASFALSVDLFWQGLTYRGYFENFSYDESAQKPGHFDYKFSFVGISKSGERKNFMPWHKNPYDLTGQPKQASLSSEGNGADRLTFPTTQDSVLGSSTPTSTFTTTQEATDVDVNNIGVNRFSNSTRGS